MTAAPFLQVRDLTYATAASETLLQGVSFDLGEGAVLAIAGPNGAGKTTLLNMLCGIIAPSGGQIRLQGQPLAALSAQDRARAIAVVGQQDLPDGRLALRDYVALGQIPIRAERSPEQHAAHLDRVLAQTGLTALADKKIAQLSGGERQRAHIARALAQAPRLLLLDEPTNHLDPDAKGRMLSLVADLEITVVMIVHDLVMIPAFASHVALIKSGQLTGFGPVDQILTPDRVHDAFGVDYLRFEHQGRMIPALDIRRTSTSSEQREDIR